MRWRNLLGYALLMLFGLLMATLEVVNAAGYRASFEGVTDVCSSNRLTRESTIGEWCGNKIDGSGSWKDTSGANLCQYSEALDNAAWTKVNVTVTADQVRLRDGFLKAELLEPTAADSYLYQDVAGSAGDKFICSFDLRTVTGLVSLSLHAYDQAHGTILAAQAVTITNVWQEFRVEGILVTGDTHVGCTIGGNLTWSTGENVYAGRGWVVDEDVDSSIGRYHPTDATTKPRLNLSPTNGPTSVKSDSQRIDGNREDSRKYNGTDQYDSRAHHNSMNVFDTDFTLTFYYNGDLTNEDVFFAHGNSAQAGLTIWYITNGTAIRATLAKAAATIEVNSAATATVGHWNLVQIVRSSNFVTIYLNGTANTPVDVSTYGIDGSYTMYLGRYNIGGFEWPGKILYTRIDAKALPTEELAYDREVLSGLASNQRYNALSVTRSTTAFVEFADMTMAEIPVNTARVGGRGGGLDIEGPATNLMKQSQDFSTTWSTIAATISTDVAMAPDGQTTVDGIVGDAIDLQHGVAQNLITLTAESWTLHTRAKKGDQDWLYLDVSTIANATAYFNIVTGFVGTTGAAITNSGIRSGWDGYYHAWITFTGTAALHTFCVYSAEADNDNQFLGDGATINTYVWQAQIEKGSFPTSIIPTFASSVTRNADDITLEPNPGEPWKQVLADSYGGSGEPDKITLHFESKCRYSASSNLSASSSQIEISGNTGTASGTRNRFYVIFASDGRIYFTMRDDADVDHQVYTGVDPVDLAEWHTWRFVVDFADFSRMDAWLNDDNSGMTYSGNSGTAEFDLTDTKIRFGQERDGTVSGNCRIRRPLIESRELRASQERP